MPDERTEGDGDRRTAALADAEQNFSAWIRTGVTAAVAGFAAARFLFGRDPEWIVRTLAALFMVAGAIFIAFAVVSYKRDLSRMQEHRPALPLWAVTACVMLIEIGIAIGIFLVFSQ